MTWKAVVAKMDKERGYLTKKLEDERTDKEMEEKMERFKRRNNLIIYGMPECASKEEDERLKSDEIKVEKLFKELEVTAKKMNVKRLGNKVTIDNRQGTIDNRQ